MKTNYDKEYILKSEKIYKEANAMLRNEYSKRRIKEYNKKYNQINYNKLQEYFKQ